MKDYFIYLAGGMSKFGKDNFEESNSWRKQCISYLNNHTDRSCYDVHITNPNNYFNFLEDVPTYESQREVMEFDLNRVRKSDLIIVNFNDPASLGTMAELAIAYEKKIPVVGLNEYENKLHPWQNEMCNRIFPNIDDLLNYIVCYYLS